MPAFPANTALAAALLTLLQIALTFLIVRFRRGHRVNLGDGGDAVLLKRIRMHGNLTENAPLFLILSGMLEIGGSAPLLVRIIGPVFVIARLCHAYGVSEWATPGGNPFRVIGMGGTLVCLAVLAVALIIRIM